MSFPGSCSGKNQPANAGVIRKVSSIPGWRRSSGLGIAIPSSVLAWRIPWTGEPRRLQSLEFQRVAHN